MSKNLSTWFMNDPLFHYATNCYIYIGPAMIWALLWKHGGLLLSPNTILVSGLKSYYNFIVLNATLNGGTLALTQFTERHHEIPGMYTKFSVKIIRGSRNLKALVLVKK